MKYLPIILVSLYALLGFLTYRVIQESNLAAVDSYTINQRLGIKEKTQAGLRRLFGRASFGLYKGGARDSSSFSDLVSSYEAHRLKTTRTSWAAVVTVFVIFAAGVVANRKGARNTLSWHLAATSFFFLFIGLMAPVFSLVVSQDVPVLDEIVLKQDTKGVLSTIMSLFAANKLFVAALLFLFSVVTPLIKTGATFWILSGHDTTGRTQRFVKTIGKWSMADVFVVALLLTVFSLSGDGLTDARIGIGLYFFAGYVLLSLLATQLMPASLPKKRTAQP